MKEKLYRLLRWSEQYTKTDMVYLAKGGSWLTIGQGVTILSTLLLAAAFANLISPVTYGLYKYVLAMGGIVSAFSLTGMGTAISQAVSRGYDGALKKGFSVSLLWGIGMTVISVGFALYYYVNGNSLLALSLVIVAIFQPVLNSAKLFTAFLNGKKNFKLSTQYHLFRTTISTTVMIVVLFLTGNPVLMLLSFFITHTVLVLFLYFRTLHNYQPKNNIDPQTVPYSKHLSVMNILGTLAGQVDKILVFHFLGAAELAIYTFALAIPEQIKGAFKNLAHLALPKFAQKKDLTEVRETIVVKSLRFGLVLIIVTVLYVLVAPYIFTYIFPQYISSVPFSQLFALSFIGLVGILPTSAMQAHKKQKKLYTLNVSTSIIQILLILSGAYFYGLWGIVVARVLTRIAYSVIGYRLVLKS